MSWRLYVCRCRFVGFRRGMQGFRRRGQHRCRFGLDRHFRRRVERRCFGNRRRSRRGPGHRGLLRILGHREAHVAIGRWLQFELRHVIVRTARGDGARCARSVTATGTTATAATASATRAALFAIGAGFARRAVGWRGIRSSILRGLGGLRWRIVARRTRLTGTSRLTRLARFTCFARRLVCRRAFAAGFPGAITAATTPTAAAIPVARCLALTLAFRRTRARTLCTGFGGFRTVATAAAAATAATAPVAVAAAAACTAVVAAMAAPIA